LQIVVGVLCDGAGRPLAIEVFPGNTQDTKTSASQVDKVAERFGGGEITFVGDRGMIKSPQIKALQEEGFHFITAITKPQIETLLTQSVLQMSLFDAPLAEVATTEGQLAVNGVPTADMHYAKASSSASAFLSTGVSKPSENQP
jgi:Transposase DDE domain